MFAVIAMAEGRRWRRPQAWMGGYDEDMDGMIKQAAAYCYVDSSTDDMMGPKFAIGICGVEGEDQDGIDAWGKNLAMPMMSGLGMMTDYTMYDIKLMSDTSMSSKMDTYLSLYALDDEGCDSLSENSKLTGDFCTISEMMMDSMITAYFMDDDGMQYMCTLEWLMPADDMMDCAYGPVEDLDHMLECLMDVGEANWSGEVKTEMDCLDTRPTVKYCM